MNNLLYETILKLSFHIVPTLITTWLTQFCIITHPYSFKFVFDLIFDTRSNPILRLNLNYKKLLKSVNTIKYIFMYEFEL